jgi:hypothetical protein
MNPSSMPGTVSKPSARSFERYLRYITWDTMGRLFLDEPDAADLYQPVGDAHVEQLTLKSA